MTNDAPIIIWFRNDLRLRDNPALDAGAATGRPLILLYINEADRAREFGAARNVWLHRSLEALRKDIEAKGGQLVLRAGAAQAVLEQLVEDSGAQGIHWNRRYHQPDCDRDAQIKSHFKDAGLTVQSHKANLLFEPWEVETKTGGYYKVYTPFWRAASSQIPVDQPLSAPDALNCSEGVSSDDLSAWDLLPTKPDWAREMMTHHTPGEDGALERLRVFLDGPIEKYKQARNHPGDATSTSRLSPHFAFGEISPRQAWTAAKENYFTCETFLKEIAWREFSYHLLHFNPELPSENFKPDFNKFEWNTDEAALRRWEQGQTGYPFVDAGMRELYATGWMHNRVRMVVASFLIKHLLIDWRDGEAWFWDTLLEADIAANAASWQWVAGSGADASPYFRIFNPFTQGEKFDGNADYVRRWVPELKHMPDKFIHRPWEAPLLVLKAADVKLGETYPEPIVDHKFARERALEGYKATKS